MIRRLGVWLASTVLLVLPSQATAQQPSPSRVTSSADARALIDRYCVTCHSDRLKTGGFSLQGVDLTDTAANGERLEKVVRKLELGAMPPAGLPRPDHDAYTALTSWLERELDRAAAARPNPGRTEALHRLNRAEYQNAVRDLLRLEGMDIALMLPPDDASYGFDNIAGILGMSPTHLERYVGAARKISRAAIGDPTAPTEGETHMIRPDLSQEDRLEDLPFGTRGGTRLQRFFPVDGEYVIRFQAHTGVGTAEKEANHIELTVDGRRVFFERMDQKPVAHTGNASDVRADTDWEVRTPIRAGLRDIAVTFVKTTSAQAEDLLRPYLRPPGVSSFRLTRMGGYRGPYVAQISILGPFNPTEAGDTQTRRRIFVCRPTGAAEERPCARKIVATLTRRAYRRPVSDTDVNRLLAFYDKERAAGGTFDRGIQMALERLLVSPEFLFRIEVDPPGVAPATPYRISDLELASRLSFFLWSSLPDDELLDVAERNELHEPAVFEAQVRRMLADSRGQALVENFAGQWLRLRNVQGTDPNTRMFPDYDETLRQAFRRETELFFGSIVEEDRSVLDLLDADYTFVNERLARHYGIPNVYGSRFRRVQLTDPRRQGLLGHGSILTVTSHATRTSPVLRGKWVLENLLGAPPPPPPPDVPALEDTVLQGTLRQRMEQHRKNPVCASCHKMTDPLGFALENFDAVGAWRTHDSGLPVDASGNMLDGTPFDGVTGLRSALRDQAPDMFVMTLTERLMTYALGRGVEYYDMPAIRQIARESARDGYRFSSLVLSIVKSAPFRMRLSEAPSEAVTTAAAR
ncbi:MAG: DUF1592 domain-containing protein [Acidimicrobiia bacterium]|nr:DUF1592 domain-containing protein [Acidimicrobiia bacterium]